MSPFTFNHSSISFTSLIVILALGLLSLTILSGTLFTVSSAHAENVRYDVNINSSLTLGFSADTVSLNLNPGSKTFASEDITTTVSTNNQYGYDLYVTSNGTDLINQTDNTYTIPTLPSKEGGYDTDSFLADKWGVMMNNTSYEPFISGTTISQSNTATNADNTILTFGAKTSYNTAPGNYKLALNFQLVARVATNDLTFTFAGSGVESVKVCKVAGNCTGDNLVGIVTTSGSSVPGLEDGSTYYLYPTFTSGYEFDSWTKTSTAGTISDTSILNPTFTMSDEPASVTVTGKSSCQTTVSGTMQDFNPCSDISTTSGSLTDNRDGQVYMVAKINDDWWMTRNLAIGCNGSGSNYGSSMSSKSLTTTDSNVNTTWSTPTASLDAADGASGCTTSDTSGCNDYINPRMKCSSDYGAWYNYATATADTITGTSNDTAASKDICPAGWRLPTYSEQSGITSSSSAFSPVTGGYYINGSIHYAGRGYWWSATANSTTNRYHLRWNGSSLDISNSNRGNGFYVRCIRSS